MTTCFNLMNPLPQTPSTFQPYIVKNMALETVYLLPIFYRPSLSWRLGDAVFSGISRSVSLLTIDDAMAMPKR
jgi:hypothetical protein